ncbi:MAG: PqqD family protein [Propioniciclava sp.]
MMTLAGNIAYVVASEVIPSDASIYLMPMPDGVPLAVNGPGALILLAVLEGREPVPAVSEATGVAEAEIADAVTSFLADLLDRGILNRTDRSTEG